ncbi:MAG: hypothetical protein LKM43_05270 [Wolbachia endosymbiont of Penenirmus auritus]|nr:hypothetical protein [Wolbachia endosymbiont of Penenirmus auritus]
MKDLLYEMLEKWRPELSDKEIDEWSITFESMCSDYHYAHPCENKMGYYYQVTDKGESYFLSQHQHEFVTKLETILENNQQLSLAAVVNFMVNTVDFYVNRHFSTDDVVDLFIKVGKEHSQFPETYNSFRYETFIVILKLNPGSSFKEIWEQFDKVVSSHPSSIIKTFSDLGTLKEVCWLCENGNVEDMELFDISNFNLDKDSSEALGGLDQSEAHQFNSNYDFNLDSGHSDSIWH